VGQWSAVQCMVGGPSIAQMLSHCNHSSSKQECHCVWAGLMTATLPTASPAALLTFITASAGSH